MVQVKEIRKNVRITPLRGKVLNERRNVVEALGGRENIPLAFQTLTKHIQKSKLTFPSGTYNDKSQVWEGDKLTNTNNTKIYDWTTLFKQDTDLVENS